MNRSAPSAEPAPEQGGRGLCTIVASNYVSLARTLIIEGTSFSVVPGERLVIWNGPGSGDAFNMRSTQNMR